MAPSRTGSAASTPAYQRAVIDPRGVAALTILFLVACREPPKPQRTEPWPAPLSSTATSTSKDAGPSRARYGLERGKMELDVVSGDERARGSVTKFHADIDVDWLDPTKTTGSIQVELDALEIAMPEGTTIDAERTQRAREALGGASGTSAGVAVFSIRALEPLRQGAWLVRGDLALHGIRAPESVEIGVTPSPNPAESPADRLVIRSLGPLVVSLSTHDIRPNRGRSPRATREASSKAREAAEEARVSFELTLARKH